MTSKVFNAFEGCLEELAIQRPQLQDIDTEIFPPGAPHPKSLIEIFGQSETGKSMLLWRLMAHALPPTHFGGRNCDVIFIDLRHKFQVQQIEEQLKRVAIASGEQHTSEELDDMVAKCLESLHVLNCYTRKHFDAALEMTDALLVKYSDCALITIDGLDAFYWLDTYERQQRMQTHYARNLDRLRSLCKRHGVCCAYTINANYLGIKRIKGLEGKETDACSVASANLEVDYKFYLELCPDGSRSMNGISVVVKDDGLHIVK